MSTPVNENSTLLIDHLDFDIKCDGIKQGSKLTVCSKHAVYLIAYDCGCTTFKCVECTARLKIVIDQWKQHHNTTDALCANCANLRNDDNLVIRPL